MGRNSKKRRKRINYCWNDFYNKSLRKHVTHNNYHLHTIGVFKGCKSVPNREPDHVSGSGSKYWIGEDSKGKYVIRASDHWRKIKRKDNGHVVHKDVKRIRTCFWDIKEDPQDIEDHLYLLSVENVGTELVGKIYLKNMIKFY